MPAPPARIPHFEPKPRALIWVGRRCRIKRAFWEHMNKTTIVAGREKHTSGIFETRTHTQHRRNANCRTHLPLLVSCQLRTFACGGGLKSPRKMLLAVRLVWAHFTVEEPLTSKYRPRFRPGPNGEPSRHGRDAAIAVSPDELCFCGFSATGTVKKFGGWKSNETKKRTFLNRLKQSLEGKLWRRVASPAQLASLLRMLTS